MMNIVKIPPEMLKEACKRVSVNWQGAVSPEFIAENWQNTLVLKNMVTECFEGMLTELWEIKTTHEHCKQEINESYIKGYKESLRESKKTDGVLTRAINEAAYEYYTNNNSIMPSKDQFEWFDNNWENHEETRNMVIKHLMKNKSKFTGEIGGITTNIIGYLYSYAYTRGTEISNVKKQYSYDYNTGYEVGYGDAIFRMNTAMVGIKERCNK